MWDSRSLPADAPWAIFRPSDLVGPGSRSHGRNSSGSRAGAGGETSSVPRLRSIPKPAEGDAVARFLPVLVMICKPLDAILVCVCVVCVFCVCGMLVRYTAASSAPSCNTRTNVGRVRGGRTWKTIAGIQRTRRCKSGTPRLPTSLPTNAVVK